MIIENTEDINSKNDFGRTPIHEAASCGHFEVSKLIIEKIEDKNPKSNHGETPLHLAAKSWSAVTEQGKYKLYVCEFL